MDSRKNIQFRFNIFVLFISFLSSILILINISSSYNIFKDIPIISSIYQISLLFAGIFTILCLPAYPIYFMILKDKEFTILVRIMLLIITNCSFYILVGYIAYFINIPITEQYFFILNCLITFILFIIGFGLNYKMQSILIQKSNHKKTNTSKKEQNLFCLKFLKENLSKNSVLLVIFIFLLCLFDIIRVGFFLGTDPWYHIFIVKYIEINKNLPLEFYFENLGLHIFTLVIHYFTNVDIFLIPRFFIFFTFSFGALIVYNFLKTIFNEQNLALFGVFLIEISFLGFSFIQYQFWPTSLAMFQCLVIFYLLYRRQERFIKAEHPSSGDLKSDIIFTYLFIILTFISSFFTHSLVTMVFIISFSLIYLIYFLKNGRRGIDLILLLILCGVFGLFYLMDFAVGHFSIILFFVGNLNMKLGLLLLGGIPFIILLIYIIVKSIDFEMGKYEKTIKNQWYLNLEKKYVIPLIFSGLIITAVIFFIGNLFWFQLNITTILVVIQDGLFVLFSVWGFALYQKKPKGKFLFIWFINFFLILGAGLLQYLVFGGFSFFGRIFLFSSVAVIMGFVSYGYKLIKTHSINLKIVKLLIVIFVIFSIFTTFSEERDYYETYTIDRNEIENVLWMSEYTYEKNIIILEFSWEYLFYYYDYPYNNSTISPESMHHFITINKQYLLPDNHINQNNQNILKNLKDTFNADVYIFLTDKYITFSGFGGFGEISPEIIENYFNLTYLNRICSTKSISGIDEPIYWVI